MSIRTCQFDVRREEEQTSLFDARSQMPKEKQLVRAFGKQNRYCDQG